MNYLLLSAAILATLSQTPRYLTEIPTDGIPPDRLKEHASADAALTAARQDGLETEWFPRECAVHGDCECQEPGLVPVLLAACAKNRVPDPLRPELTWRDIYKQLHADDKLYRSKAKWASIPCDEDDDGFFVWYPDCECCDADHVRWNGSVRSTPRIEVLTAPFLKSRNKPTVRDAVRLYKMVARAPSVHLDPSDQDRIDRPIISAEIEWAHADVKHHNIYMKVNYVVKGNYRFSVYIHEQLRNPGTRCAYVMTRYYSRTGSVFHVMSGIDCLIPQYAADGKTFRHLFQITSLLYHDGGFTAPCTAARESLSVNRLAAERKAK